MWAITWLTLRVSATGTLLSLLLGVPLGTFLGLSSFPGRRLALSLVNVGMGLPPVVAGLWVSLFLWRSGPLGRLELMYTPAAMAIAQAVIAAPIVTGLCAAAVQAVNPRLRLQILSLGASPTQMLWLLLREARLGLLAAVMAGFGAAVSEVGASMMVGGNVLGQTRVLTTATLMEVSRGHFDVAIALSVILMALAFGITAALTAVQQRGERRGPA
ncbi:MAG: ABC transporter permease [Acetobacteraceae bacterium]|nr:ABC transporter permease [Acetobacteraceae bacterium]